MIRIDGQEFHVGIEKLGRGEEREYKYDLMAEDGTRRSEIRARYRTYDVTLGSLTQAQYDALRSVLATDAPFVSVTLPDGQRDTAFDARVELGADALGWIECDGTNHWDGLTLQITGVRPLEDGA